MPNHLRTILLIARRDWLESVSTKMFWIGALLGPILMVVLMVIVGFASISTATSKGQYAVIDNSTGLAQDIRNEIVRRDLQTFLFSALLQESESIEVLDELQTKLVIDNTIEGEAVFRFIEEVLPYINDYAATGSTTQERFAAWWKENRDVVIDRAPAVSMSRYIEFRPSIQHSEESLQQLVDNEVLLGYFVIPENIVDTSTDAKFVTKNILKNDVASWYSNYATSAVRAKRVAATNVQEDDAQWIMQRVSFATNKAISPDDLAAGQDGVDRPSTEEVTAGEQIARFAPAIYQYILWFMVFMGSMMLMTGTVEEKSTKLVEVLLSNADAGQLMDGKLIGITATLLTVVGVWISFIAVPVTLGLFALPQVSFLDVDIIGAIFKPAYVVNFVIFLALGFVFFGYLFSAVGSACASIRDAQVFSTPITILLIVPVMLMVPLAMDPTGMLATILKFFPPYTPFVMMNTAAELPSLPVYLLILVWMLLWTCASRWVAARVYQKGMLMESKPKGFKELVRLVKT